MGNARLSSEMSKIGLVVVENMGQNVVRTPNERFFNCSPNIYTVEGGVKCVLIEYCIENVWSIKKLSKEPRQRLKCFEIDVLGNKW